MPDTAAPVWPEGALLSLSATTETRVTVTWPAAQDDVAVTGYVVRREGAVVGEVSGTTTTVAGLTVGRHERLTVAAKDAAGNESAALKAEVSGVPVMVLPTTDESLSTDFCAAMQFVFQGPAALQQGVDATKVGCDVVASLHGRVLTGDGVGLPGVTVTVHGRPELGRTVSRGDGAFDVVVPAGQHTVTLAATAFLTAQRQVTAVRGRMASLEDVVLLRVDEKATVVPLPAGGFHEASVQRDDAGTRAVRLFIPPGTTAVASMPDGTTRPLSTVTVRVTEFTVGARGVQAMPGSLPAASAYTFAAEFSVDEARAMGAVGVDFSQPVVWYADNFLSAAVGTTVPLGSYRPSEARWRPEANAVVVQVLAGGLDVTGDMVADETLPLVPSEASVLGASLPGGQYVRATTSHFSTEDANYAWQCDGTCAPGVGAVAGACPSGCKRPGSIIDVQNQTVSEAMPLAGTGLTAFLHGHRQPRASFSLDVPLVTGVDGGVKGAQAGRVVLDIGGRQVTTEVADAGEGAVARVTWDGKDAWGRTVRGPVAGVVQSGFVYSVRYVWVPRGTRVDLTPQFGAMPTGATVTAGPSRRNAFISTSQEVLLGNWVGPEALGGLSLDVLHGYSASTGTLYTGGGDTVRTGDVRGGATVTVFAGGGTTRLETGPAAGASLNQPGHLTLGPDGSLYFVDNGSAVRRLTPDGQMLSTVAGGLGRSGFAGDGQDAKAARFSAIDGLAVTASGDVYIADTGNHRLRKVDAQTGVVTTVVGTGVRGVPTSGAQATTAPLDSPRALLASRDGSVLFFTFNGVGGGDVLYRLTTDGRVERLAGGGTLGSANPLESSDASAVSFGTFGKRLAEGPDGSVYVTDARSLLRRVHPDGRVSLVAGAGASNEDGVTARGAQLGDVMGLAVDATGVVYFTERSGAGTRRGGRVRMVGPDGRIATVAGDGTFPAARTPDTGVPGPAARLGGVREVVAHPDGRVFFVEEFLETLQVLTPQGGLSLAERAVGSGDGTEMYIFDATGRHRRTIDTRTGAVVLRFGWDTAGRLESVTDRNGDVTQVLRDSAGRFAGFKAQDGQTLTATLDAQGRVSVLSDAASRTVRVGWNAAGLPASWEDANGNVSRFEYDADGRLEVDVDAQQGERRLSREATSGGYTVTFRTPAGRVTQYGYSEAGPLKSYRNVFPDGTTTWTRATGGTVTTDFPDGTFSVARLASDSRFGSQSTYPSAVTTTLPSGLSRAEGLRRTVTLATPGDVSQVSRLEEETTVNGKRWLTVYTAVDRTVRVTSPVGRVSSVTVDEKGRPVSWVSPGVLATTVALDARGRPQSVTQGARRVALTYGANGFVDSAMDGLARTTRLGTEVTGRLQSVTRPDMAVSGFDWDGVGNLTSLTPPGKPAHTFRYSKLREMTAYAPPVVPGVGEETYRWTKDSQVEGVTHPDGMTTTVVRDMAGRVARVEAPWATTTVEYAATTGQVVATTRGGQRVGYGYDGFLPVSEKWAGPVTGVVGWRYDEDFRVTEVSVNDAGVRYGYDDDGLLVLAGPVAMARVPATGQLQTATVGPVVTTYSYDGYGASAAVETRVSGSSVFGEVLTWDDIGRVVGKDVTVQGVTTRWVYGYDGASRLSEARRDGQVVGSWAYDGNGNRVSANGETSTVDVQDRLLTSGSTTYGHDAFGHRIRKTEGGQTTRYVYDGVGGLLSATLPDGTRLEYVIDGRGRRVGKRRNGALEKGWLYDGQLRVVAETDGRGAVVSRFIYGTLSHSPDVMVRGAATYRLVHDVLGSVRLVVDVATGQVQQRLDYDAWGVVVADSNPGFQPFGFAGGLYDVDTRLTRFGARDYDAQSGRWMSPEPLLNSPAWVVSQASAGLHVSGYTYALNNPVRYVDRDGLRVELMDSEAFRIAADPRLHDLFRWLDSSPDAYRVYGNVTLAGAAAFGQFFPGEDHERGFTGARGGTIAIDNNSCSLRRMPPVFPAGHEATHAGLMDAWVNPTSSPERGPMPRELIPFLRAADPGGGLPGSARDPRTPHGRLQQYWLPR